MKKMSKRTSNRIYAAALLVLSLVIAVCANSAAEFLTDRFDLRIDLTQGRIYHLSDQTKKVLEATPDPIQIYTLFRTGAESRSIVNLLNKLASASGRIAFENVDPVRNPAFADQFDASELGIEENSLIVTNPDHSRFKVILPSEFYTLDAEGRASGFSAEQKIASAIDYVDTGKQRTILLLQGHGESTSTDLSVMTSLLVLNNYAAQDYNLTLSEGVPDPETTALVMIEPKEDITAGEYGKISEFMQNGGRLMICAGPVSGEWPNLSRLLQQYGLALGAGIVVEENAANYVGEKTSVVPRMGDTDVTFALANNKLAAIFPMSRPVKPAQGASANTSSTVLLASTEQSYLGETAAAEPVRLSESESGPFALGVAAVEQLGDRGFSYLIVYGSSGWITDGPSFQNPGNYNLLLSSLTWLYSGEAGIDIAPKPVGTNTLSITNNLLRLGISVTLIGVIPLCLLAAGAVTLLRRRQK